MRSPAILVLAASAACGPPGGDYPIVAQGGGPPTGAGATPQTIVGRVCLVTDPRDLSTCLDVGAGNLTVTVGNSTGTTAPSGSFVIDAPTAGATGTITVTGVGMVPSTQALTSNPLIPILREDLYTRMLAANDIVLAPGSGSIIGTVVRGGLPVAGVTASATPAPAFGPLFDGATATVWELDATSAHGVVWFPGAAIHTPTTVTFIDLATPAETAVGGIDVIDGGITFVEGVLP